MKDAVKMIVYDANGRILVLRRSDTHPTLALHPDFPGGDVDPGETLLQAALRELAEETGLSVITSGVAHEYTRYTPFGSAWVLYSARLESEEPAITISWEHDWYRWMHVDEFLALPRPVMPDGFLDLTRQHLAEQLQTGL